VTSYGDKWRHRSQQSPRVTAPPLLVTTHASGALGAWGIFPLNLPPRLEYITRDDPEGCLRIAQSIPGSSKYTITRECRPVRGKAA
jgi:hypothetical protein